MTLTMHAGPRPRAATHSSDMALTRARRSGCLALLLAAFVSVVAAPPASAQALTPSDPAFWVTLPDGATVPYNHPLATGGRQARRSMPAAPSAPPSAVLTPSDPGFWVTLPDGSRVPYNHPLATGGNAASAPAPVAQSAQPSAVLTPSDPGFWVTLANGAMVPYNHPDAIAAAAAASPAPNAGAASTPPKARAASTQPRATAPPVQDSAPEPDPAPAQGGTTLRVLQWNLHHGVGTDGRYDIERIAEWIARMKPDVVMLNEVEKNTSWGSEDQPARYEAMLEKLTGRRWYALFSQEFGNWGANGKGHLILSTYPFESTAREAISYSRVVGAAGITVNGRTISLIVTHLDPESHARRLSQAREVTGWAGNLAENRILTGDMNAWPDQTSIAEFNTKYRDSWTDAESRGKVSQPSGLQEAGATKNGRIDYIFYSKGAANLGVLKSQVYDTRDAQHVMPSDHRPVLTTFEVR